MEKELFTKICPVCGTAFKTYITFKKYCCHKCAVKGASLRKEKGVQPRVIVIKKCAACGKEFESHSSRHRYCSAECRLSCATARAKDKHSASIEKQICAYCGNEFSAERIKKYCSDECRQRSNAPKRKYGHGKVRMSLAEVAKRSRKENLTYGQFVAKYGL